MCFRPSTISLDKNCPECGATVQLTDTVCPECGAEIPVGLGGAPGAPSAPGAPK